MPRPVPIAMVASGVLLPSANLACRPAQRAMEEPLTDASSPAAANLCLFTRAAFAQALGISVHFRGSLEPA